MSSPNGSKKTELPEIEVKISPNWVRLIRWCQVNLSHGQLCVKIVNFEPTDLVPEYTKKRVRFDKESEPPPDLKLEP